MRQRVHTCALSGWVEPAAAFAALHRDAENAFWLDSGPGAVDGVSAMGTSSTVIADGGDGDILELLADELGRVELEPDDTAGFRLGWVGWLGYELRGRTLAQPVPRWSDQPVAAFMFVDRAVTFDHRSRTVTLLALAEEWSPELEQWRVTLEQLLLGATAEPALSRPTPRNDLALWHSDDERYLEMVRECQRAIHEGEAYQLCLTTEVTVDTVEPPLDVYLRLRASSPSHHGGLITMGGVSLLSASPEQFLGVTPEGVIATKPIKGTRPRSSVPSADLALAEELVASQKERAENLMIVDLMRNDLARVCVTGTVSVTSLLAVESYAHVHQLVSTVTGRLRAGLSAVDAVRSTFPAGSMTGAPKISATSILDRVEGRARGIYSGAFGYFGLDGRADLAMVIRSIVLDPRGATVGTGGGITALSEPGEELAEVKLKVAALLAVLGARAHGVRNRS